MEVLSVSSIGLGLIVMEGEMEENQRVLNRLLNERRLLDERIATLQRRQNTLGSAIRQTIRLNTGNNDIYEWRKK